MDEDDEADREDFERYANEILASQGFEEKITETENVKKAYAKLAYEKVSAQVLASKGDSGSLDLTQLGLMEDLLHERAWDFEKFRQAAPKPEVDLPHESLEKIRKRNEVEDYDIWINSKSKKTQDDIKRIIDEDKSREWHSEIKKRGIKGVSERKSKYFKKSL